MLRLLQNLIGYYEISIHSTNLVVAMKFSVYSRIWGAADEAVLNKVHCPKTLGNKILLLEIMLYKT
jgi:hypothetical protein